MPCVSTCQPYDRGQLDDAYGKWTVAAIARDTDKPLWEHDLPCEPIHNGLCVDRDGRAIVTLRDGGIVCFGKQ